jgi:hypothetical protein
MKLSTRKLGSLAVLCCALLCGSHASANVIERILANPKIQALIGKPAEVTDLLGLCKNVSYQRNNSVVCAEAAQADTILKLPFEMRTVMSNANSAKSLRDLCLAAQSTAQRDSYLCSELVKADKSFGDALANERARMTVQPTSGNPGNDASN